MGDSGCYVTATCKLLIHSGQQSEDFTPDKCIEALKKHGLLSNSGNLSFTDTEKTKKFLAEYAPELEYSYTSAKTMNQATAVSTIRNYINDGYYVIVRVPSSGTSGMHFIAVDEVKDNDIYVMDNNRIYALYSAGKSVTDITKFKYTGKKAYPAGPKTSTSSSASSGWTISDIATGISQQIKEFAKSQVKIQTKTQPGENMEQGKPFYFKGTITSGYNITSATVSVLTPDRKLLGSQWSKTVAPNKTTVDIATSGLDSLKFGNLAPGSYILLLTAENSVHKTNRWEQAFSIKGKVAASTPTPKPAAAQTTTQPTQPQVPQSTLTIAPTTWPGQNMAQGKPFYFKGKITSNYIITSTTISILSPDRSTIYQSATFTPNKKEVDIATSGLDSLKFGKLAPGSYIFQLIAKDDSDSNPQTWEQSFSIKGTTATSVASTLTIAPTTRPGQNMPKGKPFYFKGKITSNYNITSATISILTPDRKLLSSKWSITITPQNTKTVDIATSGLDGLKFGNLPSGSYIFQLTVKDASGSAPKTWEQAFSIR